MNEYNAGMNTTPDMWGMLSDLLAEYEEKLPISLNNAIYALRDGDAVVVPKMTEANQAAALDRQKYGGQ